MSSRIASLMILIAVPLMFLGCSSGGNGGNEPEGQSSTVPDVVGLVEGTVRQEHSNTVAAGDVISRSPAGDSSVEPGTSVDLVLSLGAEPRPTETIMLSGDVPLEMVSIPAGTFMMGRNPGEQDSAADEGTHHQVSLSSGFLMGKYEVTQAQWTAVMGSNPSSSSGDARPVEQVSWNDVQSFISVLNTQTGMTFRLPTEAEWEYACRAGTTTRFYWGDDPDYTVIGDYAWCLHNSSSRTHDVGGKLPNAWGLYDMSGNVWECCQDWYGRYSSRAVTDPTGPGSGSFRVIRGGSWWGFDGRICRSASRNSCYLGLGDINLGFRLAKD